MTTGCRAEARRYVKDENEDSDPPFANGAKDGAPEKAGKSRSSGTESPADSTGVHKADLACARDDRALRFGFKERFFVRARRTQNDNRWSQARAGGAASTISRTMALARFASSGKTKTLVGALSSAALFGPAISGSDIPGSGR